MSISETIKQTILASGGKIPFDDFMNMALYEPGLGYYVSGLPVLGKSGDFITAPELSPLFGRVLANHIASQFQGDFELIEFGAGSGALAQSVLIRLAELNALPTKYTIIDLSPSLVKQQQEMLAKDPDIFSRCHWETSLPGSPIHGAVIANEVLDAMPVSLFKINNDHRPLEGYVYVDDSEKFSVCWQEASISLCAEVDKLGELPVGYQSEVNQYVGPWLSSLSEIITTGMVLLVDYGFAASEYYHADRSSGTLMCHYQHKAHPNPLQYIGEQDITSHVNFTAVAEGAQKAGFDVAGYSSQANYLLANGLLNEIEDLDGIESFEAKQQIKQLTLPHEMGDLFKVMALTKGLSLPLLPFSLSDIRYKL